MKKIISLILCLIISLSLIACDKQENEVSNTTEKEISIIMPYDIKGIKKKIFLKYIFTVKNKFEREHGVKVKIETIEATNYVDYIAKRNAKLYLEEGPTLILLDNPASIASFVEQGVALNIDNKIPNYKNIYDSLKDDYFVPMGINGSILPLGRDILESLNIKEPSLDWTTDDFIEIYNKWLEEEFIYFNRVEFTMLCTMIFKDVDFRDEDSGKVSINTYKVKECIRKLREEIYSGKYILDDTYTFEDYYDLFFNLDLEIVKADYELYKRNSEKHIISEYAYAKWNPFDTLSIKDAFNNENRLVLPDVINIVRNEFNICGFIVNSRGSNIDEGLLFLNQLLSDEMQITFFKLDKTSGEKDYAPISKTIENEIKEIEKEKNIPKKAVELRKYFLDKINQDDFKIYKNNNFWDSIYLNANGSFKKVLVEIIFADEPYTDEEISNMLQKVEDEMNIYSTE